MLGVSFSCLIIQNFEGHKLKIIEISFMNQFKNTKTSAAKRPIVPKSGYFSTRFEAQTALKRLLSMPNRNSRHVIECLSGILASGKTVTDFSELVSPVYKLVSMMPPYFEGLSIVSSAFETLPSPTDLSAREVADSDPSGLMAAVIMMSARTPNETVNRLGLQWQLKMGTLAHEEKYKSIMIQKIIEAENAGVQWNNNQLGHIICIMIQSEGWKGKTAKAFLAGLKHFPLTMVVFASQTAPEEIVDHIVRTQTKSISTAEELLYMIGLVPANQQDAALLMVSKFMTTNEASDKEKIHLYMMLLDNDGDLWTENKSSQTIAAQGIREVGMKAFAANKSQTTFDVACGKIADGLDTVSIKEMTANLDYSLLRYSSIFAMLKKLNVLNKVDPKFYQIVESMNTASFVRNDELTYFFDDDEADVRSIFASYRWNEMELPKEKKRSSKNSVMAAAILVAIGIPISIALFRTNVTPQEFSSNPDVVRMGTAAANRANENPEIAKKVTNLVERVTNSVSAQRANPLPVPLPELLPHPEPDQPDQTRPRITNNPNQQPDAQGHELCEITPRLVDVVIFMEHDPKKDVSSAGAGGLMQLMPDTWDEINQRDFGGKYPFQKYFRNDIINQQFGTAYLKWLKKYLESHRVEWKTDELPLIFACYFGGIGNVRKQNFDPRKIEMNLPKTYTYMTNGCHLMGYEFSF